MRACGRGCQALQSGASSIVCRGTSSTTLSSGHSSVPVCGDEVEDKGRSLSRRGLVGVSSS
jgi:hypothetical protein